MAAPIFQRTIVDSDGNVEPGASVEVRDEATNELAPIYINRNLTEVKPNPFITDETGLAEFFVARGEYKVTATTPTAAIAWRFVQMLDTEFLATTDTEQTLTNKTLTSPAITTPTGLVKADVGLGNVDNTADSAKNVATAATLTTARTINGTSFNGSANITTANWGTSRTVSFTGDVTGSASVNGSADVATAMTLANSGVTAATYGGNNSIPSLVVDAKGRVTSASTVTPSGTWAISISGVAATATILATARTIGGVSFNGSANINLPGVNIAGNQDTSGNAATATNVAYSGLTGTVPTWNQNTTGNAATATALQTARTIGGVSFDGTANIDLPGVNTDGNQNTSGNAATATALATARTIGGVSFNGTANINLPGVNTAGNQNTTGTAANVTGTVAVANGGTGATSLTANNLVVGNGTSAVGFIAPGTAGNVLTSNGTVWQSVPPAASGGGVTVAASAPAGPSNGDLWFDTTNNTLKIWITSSWRGVGSYT